MADLSAAPVQEDVTTGSRIQHGSKICGAGAVDSRPGCGREEVEAIGVAPHGMVASPAARRTNLNRTVVP